MMPPLSLWEMLVDDDVAVDQEYYYNTAAVAWIMIHV